MNRLKLIVPLLLALLGITSCDLLSGGGQRLTVETSGSGQGTVRSLPAGIECGVACSATFQTGSAVTLTATPDSTSGFGGWGGACAGESETSCIVTMTSALSASASFVSFDVRLSVILQGSGSGIVLSDDGRLVCPGGCSASYPDGGAATLLAYPATGSGFDGWGGVCQGVSGSSCVVNVDGEVQVPAAFSPTAATAIGPTGSGCGAVGLGGRCQVNVTLVSGDGPYRGFEFSVESGAFALVDAAPTGVASACLASAGPRKVIVVCDDEVSATTGDLVALTLERTATRAAVIAVVDAFTAADAGTKQNVAGGAVGVAIAP